jgi:hypothetical protein
VSWTAEDLVGELVPPAAGELLAELLAGASDDLPLRLSADLAAKPVQESLVIFPSHRASLTSISGVSTGGSWKSKTIENG